MLRYEEADKHTAAAAGEVSSSTRGRETTPRFHRTIQRQGDASGRARSRFRIMEVTSLTPTAAPRRGKPGAYRLLPHHSAIPSSSPRSGTAAKPAAVSAERMRRIPASLGGRLEGRAPGTRGEGTTTDFLEAGFKKAEPAARRGHTFNVPLVRIALARNHAPGGEERDDRHRLRREFSRQSETQTEPNSSTPRRSSSDTASHRGVRVDDLGRRRREVVVLFATSRRRTIRSSSAERRLLYGRWTFKYEARAGRACFIIHE